jgi:hypothetical protein
LEAQENLSSRFLPMLYTRPLQIYHTPIGAQDLQERYGIQITKKYISQSTNNNIYQLINNYKTVNDFDKDKFAKDLTDIIGGYDYYMQYKDKSYNTMPLCS